MANINDYIKWRGDLKINSNFPFNEVDSMIMARFSYLLLDKIDLEKKETIESLSLKMDKFEQNNIFIHEIIAPKSKEDFEKSVDKFIKRKSTQINKDNNTTDSTSSMDTNKKKSKFSKKENKENINNNLKDAGEEFSPIFILNQKDLRDLYYIVEPKKTNRIKMINYASSYYNGS